MLNFFKNLSRYPRFRVLLVVGGVLVAIVIVANVMGGGKPEQQNKLPPSQVSAPRVSPSQTRTVGADIAPPPASSNTDATASAAEAKAKQKQGFFEGLFDHNADVKDQPPMVTLQTPAPNNNFPVPMPLPAAVKPVTSPTDTTPSEYGATSSKPTTRHLTSAEEGTARQLSTAMQQYLGQTSKAWALPKSATVAGAVAAAPGAGGKAGDALMGANVMIKAGTILFAVLSNTLNSDQPGTPVLATITTGTLKGAKLMGTFTLANEKLVIQFSQMSMPDWPSTIAVTAYAVDGETGANAMATGVDHHYLMRYGSLFAASFLQGFGQAFAAASGNTTDPCAGTPAGANCNVTTTPAAVTTKSAAYAGLGQLGASLGTSAAQNVNTPPTVTVAQGTGMGILFMADLPYPGFMTNNGGS